MPAPIDKGDRTRGVFINCPFDEAYTPSMDAIILATAACGFYPRSANDDEETDVARMDRICNKLAACPYSIHDLSRCRGEGDAQLARMNMPLELGIAFALNHLVADHQHRWLALVPKGPRHSVYVSDLAGYDPKTHNETPLEIAVRVFTWLRSREHARPIVGVRELRTALNHFGVVRAELDSDYLGSPAWHDVVEKAVACLRST